MTSVKRIFSDLGLQSENLDHSVRKFAETKKYFAEECEMVFVPTDGSYAIKILKNVQSLGWEGFVKHPGDYVAEIVLEFCANINKSERTSKIGDPGVNSFHGEHTGYYQSQEFSVTMAAPPPTIFSERGEAATLVPMPYRNQIFSDVPPFHGFYTIGSPSNLFNEGPSVPPRRPKLGDVDDELDFFQYNGTKTSNTDT